MLCKRKMKKIYRKKKLLTRCHYKSTISMRLYYVNNRKVRMNIVSASNFDILYGYIRYDYFSNNTYQRFDFLQGHKLNNKQYKKVLDKIKRGVNGL